MSEHLKGGASEEQIAKWKQEYGDIFAIEVDERVAYLKKPTKHILAAANKSSKGEPFKFNDNIMRMCWLGGDEEIRVNDDLSLAVTGVLDEILEVATASVKKL